MKPQRSPVHICLLLATITLIGVFCCAAHGQTPNLVVSAGSTGQAPTLTVSSDSSSPWKCFTVTAGTTGVAGLNSYQVIWAESNGTTGGIYYGSIATATSGSAGPVTPPAPTDLPLGTLTTAVSASIADPGVAATMATTYEALAKGIDTGVISSPLQLQLATGTQLLANFTADQLASVKTFNTAVSGWLDAQQCAGKLSADRMDKYSKTYHAIAAALKPGIVTQLPSTAKEPATFKRGQSPATAAESPCANGHCPTSGPSRGWGWRWR